MQILAKLDHPNIVKIQECLEDKFKIYQMIDTIQGESLFNKIIKLGQMGEQESHALFSHFLSAVRYMHKNGVVHLNLWPELVLF